METPPRIPFERPTSVADVHSQLVAILGALREHRDYMTMIEYQFREAIDESLPQDEYIVKHQQRQEAMLTHSYLLAMTDMIADKIAPSTLKIVKAEGGSVHADPAWPDLHAEVVANAKRPRVFA